MGRLSDAINKANAEAKRRARFRNSTRLPQSDSNIELNVVGIEKVIADYNKVYTQLRTVLNQREIAEAAAPYIIDAIRRNAPVSDRKIHYRYNTPKLVKRLRAPKGFGKKVAAYLSGNVRNSIIDISTRRTRYKKKPFLIIGPYYARSTSFGPFGGTPKKADAYYAHMIYGSAKAFAQRVTYKGFNEAKGAAMQAALKKGNQILEEVAMKNGFKKNG